jgi:hypothetical protein
MGEMTYDECIAAIIHPPAETDRCDKLPAWLNDSPWFRLDIAYQDRPTRCITSYTSR